MMQNLKYRTAEHKDIPLLIELMNSAFRSDVGRSWTSETEIVEGDRINQQQLEQYWVQDNFQLIVAELDHEIVACIGLTFLKSSVEIGTFSIASQYQNLGIGKHVLSYAEEFIKENAQVHEYVMWVLNVRLELIAYYERRGYVPTGVKDIYPVDAGVGQPLVELHLIEMAKPIT